MQQPDSVPPASGTVTSGTPAWRGSNEMRIGIFAVIGFSRKWQLSQSFCVLHVHVHTFAVQLRGKVTDLRE